MEPNAAEADPEVQLESGALSMEVFDSGKVIFPDDVFANFNSFVDVFDDDDGEGFLYPALAAVEL